MKIIPVILSGGSGTRLWPLSRRSKPKQFLKFGTNYSLFQNAVLRCQTDIFDDRPIIVGAADHRFMIAEDLLEMGIEADIVLEPEARNSCAAIAAGCLQAASRSHDGVVLVIAADHHIPDRDAFASAVGEALEDAVQGYLVTFGITPEQAVSGYGYILPGETLCKAQKVDRFVEKPDGPRAAELVAAGYLWNSGNFLFRSDAFIAQLRQHATDVFNAVSLAFAKVSKDLDFLRLDEEAFARAPSISVDHAIFERTDQAAVLRVDYGWSDIGSWDALANVLPGDDDGNVVVGDAVIANGSGNIVHSEDKLAALIGVKDTVVVTTRDAVLVAARERAEDVKALVQTLTETGRREANEAMQTFRPWGHYEQLECKDRYQVKRITVSPGGMLSLQKHQHRSEHWVMVEGRAEVTIDDRVQSLEPNQSVYVPAGSTHRLANRGSEPAVLIEVQTGSYLGEDDIVRIDDVYGR